MKKAIFFDIDGTLLAPRDGQFFVVPPSALQAIRRAEKNGHRVVICSGRQEPFIHKYFPGLFQSYIAMNGSYGVFEGKIIFQEFYSQEKVEAIIKHFDAYGAVYNFVGNQHGWPRNLNSNQMEMLNRIYGLGDYLQPNWNPEDVQAGAMDFLFRDQAHYRACLPAFSGGMVLNLHGNGLSGDLSFPGADKAYGIRRFCDYAGIDLADTVAFGDGYNDQTMMKTVGIGVAMGNAVPPTKQAADYVTDSIFCDGVQKGLEYLGLI